MIPTCNSSSSHPASIRRPIYPRSASGPSMLIPRRRSPRRQQLRNLSQRCIVPQSWKLDWAPRFCKREGGGGANCKGVLSNRRGLMQEMRMRTRTGPRRRQSTKRIISSASLLTKHWWADAPRQALHVPRLMPTLQNSSLEASVHRFLRPQIWRQRCARGMLWARTKQSKSLSTKQSPHFWSNSQPQIRRRTRRTIHTLLTTVRTL
mmetsp:Transcript_45757/g.76272  ORF Transcript_45757/g.76272 Transcript_45757/m.76272 type:complete len:206 (+) Transcript_45757:221-838(+)